MLKKIISIIVILAGIFVIVFGISVSSPQTVAAQTHTPTSSGKIAYYSDSESVSAGNYSVEFASFGADFYTYIYKASRTMGTELNEILKVNATTANNLNEIDHALETVVKAENEIYTATIANIEAIDAVNSSILTMEANNAKNTGLLVISIGALITIIGLLALADAFTKHAPKPVPVHADAVVGEAVDAESGNDGETKPEE